MIISDLITVRDATRSIDLAAVDELSQRLEAEGADLTLGSVGDLQELLGEYVSGQDAPVDVLRVLLGSLTAHVERGGAFLVRGAGGAGKSHLLAALALLLRHATAWPVLIQGHPGYSDLRTALKGRRFVVVPIALSEHRGHDEHLEDVIFDKTEQVLRAAPFEIALPLSDESHALDLVIRHIVPRYSQELDSYTRKHVHPRTTWDALRRKAPGQAVHTARQFAQEIGYPLDFRQSRVERLSSLLEVVRERELSGIVWLLDDLHHFLSGVSTKAVHGDCSFLDFIGQRAKIGPLHLIATLGEGLDQVGMIEPYLLNAIRSSYRTDVVLSAEQMRTVARRRLVERVDDAQYEVAMAKIRTAYSEAFGSVAFTGEDLAEAYPLHPLALECLESIAQRFFGAADSVAAFLHDLLDQTQMAGLLHRDFCRLITIEDVFDYLRPRIASHPEVAAYIYDALDFYDRNAHEIWGERPELCSQMIRALILLRLSNTAASVGLLCQALGLTEGGAAVVDAETAGAVLEAMRLAGTFVDKRRRGPDGPPVYVVDVQTSVTEAVRRRIAAKKTAVNLEDPGAWLRVLSACDEAAFPLAQLVEARTLEVQWQNSFRCVSAHIANAQDLSLSAVSGYVSDLGDPSTVEDANLLLGSPVNVESQARVWSQLRETALSGRWAAAVLLWLPRGLTAQELDAVREFVAVEEGLEEEGAAGEDSGVRDQLVELHGPLLAQTRRAVRDAYYGGEVISLAGQSLAAGELSSAEGNWSATLEIIVAPALARVFPDFAQMAPRRPLVTREHIDALVDQVIRPGAVTLPPGGPLRDLVDSFLVPLGLVTITDDQCAVDVSRSRVAADIQAKVRVRDQTPQYETGRAVSCSYLAQHLVKSGLGLPPELFELVIGALLAAGYLAVVRDETELVPVEQVATPLSGSVQFVARPPLMPPTQWQLLSRVTRVLLDLGLSGPEHGAQVRVWRRLVAARAEHLQRVAELRRRLEAHIEALGQGEAHWRQMLGVLDDLVRCLSCIRPELHPAIGLQEFINDVTEFLKEEQGTIRLGVLFRLADRLEHYLDNVAKEVVGLRRYLLSGDLSIADRADLETRRQTLLQMVGSGEALLSEEMALRRQVQIFLASYKRHYISWHGRVYRAPVFDQYRAVHQSPEMRAALQLGKLQVNVPVTAQDMGMRVEAEVGRRCNATDLSETLDRSPVCTHCRLRLDEEPNLTPVDALLEQTREVMLGYVAALGTEETRQRIRDYAGAMPRRGDLPARLLAIADLGAEPGARELLSLFTEDAVVHINRVLSGKTLAPRNFGELRDALRGRTLTRAEAQELFQRWMSGDGGPDGDELLQIDD